MNQDMIINSVIRQMILQRYLQELKMNDPRAEKRAMLGSQRPWTEADRVELDSAGPFQQSSRSNPATGYNEGQERRDATTTASGGEISFNRQGPWYAGRNIPSVNTPLANELRSTVDMGRRAEAGARASAAQYQPRGGGYDRLPATMGKGNDPYLYVPGELTKSGIADKNRWLEGTENPSASSYGPGPNSEAASRELDRNASGSRGGYNPMGWGSQNPGMQPFDFKTEQRRAWAEEQARQAQEWEKQKALMSQPQDFPGVTPDSGADFYQQQAQRRGRGQQLATFDGLTRIPPAQPMDASYFQRDPFQPSPASRIRPAWADLAW